MKVMFICTGNICRSAMAHAMFENMVKEYSKNVKVYSCGIFAENADIPTIEAVEAMKEYKVKLKDHRATNIKSSEIENMDLILCATTSHKNNVINMYPNLKDKVFTIKEYAEYSSNDLDIKDPWGYSIETYKKCAKEIKDCLEIIIKKVN